MPSAVEIRGSAELLKALSKFEPDLKKEVNKKIGAAMRPIVREAKGYVPEEPMSNWMGRSFSEARFPTWNYSAAKKGIGYSVGQSKPNNAGWTSLVRIYNKTASGAIAETAGRRNPTGQSWVGRKEQPGNKKVSHSNNPRAGAQFIANLGQLYGDPKIGYGRYIYRAYKNNDGAAVKAIMAAIDDAEQQFYARIGQAA